MPATAGPPDLRTITVDPPGITATAVRSLGVATAQEARGVNLVIRNCSGCIRPPGATAMFAGPLEDPPRVRTLYLQRLFFAGI